MKEKKFELKTNDLIKDSIIYLVFRYNGLTAKEIQEKLGLKRQTTYNYLNELVENKEIETQEKFLESNPNVKTIVYTYKRRTPVSKTYNFRLMDVIKDKNSKKIRKELNDQIKMSLASLIETLGFINTIEDKDLLNYALNSNFGPGIDMILLSDNEYEELGRRFQEVLRELWNKWNSRTNEENEKEIDKHMFFLGGFRSFFDL